MPGGARDLLHHLSPAQGSGHRHAGLEIRVGVVLAEAGDLAVVRRRPHGCRCARWRYGQLEPHRPTGVVLTHQADGVGVRQQSPVVAASGPRRGPGTAAVVDVEIPHGHGQLALRPRLQVGRGHVVIRVGAVVAGIQVEQRHRVEVRDHGSARLVLVEDRQKGKGPAGFGGIELSGDEPGIGLLVGVCTFGGGKSSWGSPGTS